MLATFANLIVVKKTVHIALVGNPNSGKTSLFNVLTGLNQRTGNFPGVTVDKKTGSTHISSTILGNIIDLPGTYSLYPKRLDEWVSYRVLLNQDKEISADVFVVVVDASNLKRNLLFCSQIMDLKKPVVVALTMVDIAKRKGIEIDLPQLERELGVPVVSINPRKEKGVAQLKKAIELTASNQYKIPVRDFIENRELATAPIEDLQAVIPDASDYSAIHFLINHEEFELDSRLQATIESIEQKHNFNHTKTQATEILQRYHRIRQIMQTSVTEPDPNEQKRFTAKMDDVLLHRTWGYFILMAVLFLLFQSVFYLAQYPMTWIEEGFSYASTWLNDTLPAGWFSDLTINGILAGLSGILIFVPQIMILFGLITILEDTGYMARISFLTDRLMRSVGLNGKSVMPLISGFACAVPAIMSARNIENRKERLLTILITPLMSCSARLPVYTILIALVIPNKYYLGIFSLQALIMMGLYLLGFAMAMLVSWIAKWFIHIKEKSFFILELPTYRPPRAKTIAQTMLTKARIFVTDAGKIIMVISLILWALSSFGPSGRMADLDQKYEQQMAQNPAIRDSLKMRLNTAKLENSYAGILGKGLEPAIKPLGYDWRIGIALVTSFAAREVFVGTMATLFSVADEEEGTLLREKMATAKKSNGEPLFTVATGVSLMIFYLFAMQCMSTLAIVKRETRTWKWPVIQLIYMTGIAYLMSFIAYQLLK
ncbi:MAG: ferrous iron transport protein B [Chitinophagaceae bacterium]|nr:MAG: ferrous iron transport protein B [Chitinophagaceae bacterium]